MPQRWAQGLQALYFRLQRLRARSNTSGASGAATPQPPMTAPRPPIPTRRHGRRAKCALHAHAGRGRRPQLIGEGAPPSLCLASVWAWGSSSYCVASFCQRISVHPSKTDGCRRTDKVGTGAWRWVMAAARRRRLRVTELGTVVIYRETGHWALYRFCPGSLATLQYGAGAGTGTSFARRAGNRGGATAGGGPR